MLNPEEEIIRDELIRRAKLKESDSKCLAPYGELAELIGLDMYNPPERHELGNILWHINQEENEEDRPLLSALVILKETKKPADGFFESARDLNLFSNKNETVRIEFWINEVKRVRETWA